ncbi:MAG TPA: hypothetical protein DDX39_12550 [Bacteroidales bacterium]|nr:MAG: hypothetical protein A2W98_05445 [Bacteroidetes bacterium GWF2_33_38]OFY92024.1 MAG: hypothetical protein A2236_10205 [Bacteroidetes bacterium RIFOXYA2_FULL_33_7]HBF89462.1 hypothetical protein [Bacteroidales bacterium]
MRIAEINNLLFVNMPDCSNLLFVFKNSRIVSSKRIADINAKNAISFYKLTFEIQNAINIFVNPKAI